MTAIRLALVNDHPLVVEGLRALLAPDPGIDVVELDALTDVAAPVDIALVDTFSQSENIAQAVSRRVAEPTVGRVAVYSWQPTDELVRSALSAGASGVLSKTLGRDELVEALQRIADGDQVVVTGPADGSDDVDEPPTTRRQGRDWPGREYGLSMREAEMISLICQGHSNDDICRMLFLSLNSVKSYIRTAYAKIGAQSRSQAVIWGIEHGLRPAAAREPVDD